MTRCCLGSWGASAPTSSQRRVCPWPPGQSGWSLSLCNDGGELGDLWEWLSSPCAQLPRFIPAVCQVGLGGQSGSASVCPKGSHWGVVIPGPPGPPAWGWVGKACRGPTRAWRQRGRRFRLSPVCPAVPRAGSGARGWGDGGGGKGGKIGGRVPGPVLEPEGPEAPGGFGTGAGATRGRELVGRPGEPGRGAVGLSERGRWG